MKTSLRLTYGMGLAVLVSAGIVTLVSTGVTHRAGSAFQTPFRFEPFTQDLPIPPDVQPVGPFAYGCELPDLPELREPVFYELRMRKAMAEILPGVRTEIWGYDGLFPGPTFRVDHNVPAVVRFHNDLDQVTIVHNHGGHQSSESDGSASVEPDQLIPPGEYRDFCYPHIAPLDPATGEQDMSDFASTQWYHDHAHLPMPDMGLTGENVYMGLAGFYLLTDDLEKGLVADGVLPGRAYDVPLILQDRVFDAHGALIYEPEGDNHDGVLGDVFVVNGKAQPVFHVERRKYRFRILNGANARFYELRLTSGKFVQIGADSWLLPYAVRPTATDEDGTREDSIQLSPAERADVIVDFRYAPDVVYLENVLLQDDGRRPNRVEVPGTPLLKFVVEGPPVAYDATVEVGTLLRPHTPIREDEIVATRELLFERRGGEWVINGERFDPHRDDATPLLGTAERWILKNGGGGWAHPIHLHLEAHQVQRLSRRELDPQERFKKDTVRLNPGEEAEVFVKFRTFPGRFVFHCHNLEHEDMAMMGTFHVLE